MTLAKDLPAKLTLTPQLPELRGTSKSSFEYQLSIKNDSGKKLMVSLAAQAPQNFDTSFTEQYGSQELNAVPVDAGQTQGREAQGHAAEHGRRRQLPVTVRVDAEDATATANVALDITGQPKLALSGREGLSRRVRCGRQGDDCRSSSPTPAPRRPRTSRCPARAPSGWKVTFEPEDASTASRRTRTRRCRR